jgi:hypothetical protein
MPEQLSREDRELEIRSDEISAGLARVVEINRTIRFCFGVLGFVATVAIVSYAVIQIVSQPPWLVLALAIFGPSGLLAGLGGAYIRYLKKRLNRLQQQLQQPPNAPHIGETK